MIEMTTLNTVLTLSVSTLALAWAVKLVKSAFIDYSATIQKETDMGEHVNLNVNFSLFDSKKAMKRKLETLWELSDARKEFTYARFQQKLAEAQEEKKSKVVGVPR
jgi:hypothetical protein